MATRSVLTDSDAHNSTFVPKWEVVGGDEGTRTPDPLLAKEVLSQLSYIPTPVGILARSRACRGGPFKLRDRSGKYAHGTRSRRGFAFLIRQL
jgi:hypothetical protein